MIDLSKLIRKSDVGSLWRILGEKWARIRANKNTKKSIESLWSTSELLSNGRLNTLYNIYNKSAQLNIFSLQDVFYLENINKSKIIKNYSDNYNFEFRIPYDSLRTFNNSKIQYVEPPVFFTNTTIPPEYLPPMFTGFITRVNTKERKLTVLKDSLLSTYGGNLYGYIFLDIKNIPFIIERYSDNNIYYNTLFTDSVPAEGEFSIVNKFELKKDKDFVAENFDNLIKFRFKTFNAIDSIDGVPYNIFDKNIDLYTVNLLLIDNYIDSTFATPISIKKEHITSLKNSGYTIPKIQEKLLQFWRVNQREYNFQQLYRLAAIIGDQSGVLSINNPEVIYKIDKPNYKVYTSKLKNETAGTITNFLGMPEILKNAFSSELLDETEYSVIKLEDNFNTFGISFNDILIIDNISYRIKKIYGEKYLQVDSAISKGSLYRDIKILPKADTRVYDVGKYGFSEQFTVDSLSGKINLGAISFGDLNWGEFNWGDQILKDVSSLCKFKDLEIGQELYYGDAFNQLLSIDYFENNTPPGFIQKELALMNKKFSTENADNIFRSRCLLILPFLNYSYKENILQNDVRSDTGWTLSSGVTTDLITESNYLFKYTNIKFEELGNTCYFPINLSTENYTDISLLRFYIRKKEGSIKCGLNNDASFLTIGSKKILVDIQDDKWNFVNIFINRKDINQDSNKIFFEASQDVTEIDIFGIEMFNNIPTYLEKLYNNKQILTDLISSFDYKTLNLL